MLYISPIRPETLVVGFASNLVLG